MQGGAPGTSERAAGAEGAGRAPWRGAAVAFAATAALAGLQGALHTGRRAAGRGAGTGSATRAEPPGAVAPVAHRCLGAATEAEAPAQERARPRGLDEPDDRPVGEADLTNPEAREAAMFYLQKKQKIEDERFQTEEEWIHMFSHVGDLGAAIELGAKKEALDQQLEEMAEREAEIAEQLVEIRELRKKVNSGQSRLRRLQGELEHEGTSSESLQSDLQELQSQCDEKKAEASRMRAMQTHMRARIDASQGELASAVEESARLKEDVRKLESELAEAEGCVGPRREEVAQLNTKVAALENEIRVLAEDAKRDAAELVEAEEEVEKLRTSKDKMNEQCKALRSDIKSREAALNDLPAEVESSKATLESLQAQVAELDTALGPAGEKLAGLREACRAKQEELGTLRAEHAFSAKEAEAIEAEIGALSRETASLEDELDSLLEKKKDLKAERARLAGLQPELISQRDGMLNEVAVTLEETRGMRADLLSKAREAQTRLKELDLDEALAAEEKVLQSTAAEVGLAATTVSDGLRKAQAAFERASALRQRAADDFARFNVAMEKRLAALQAQETMLAATVEAQQDVEAEVRALVETSAAHAERFRGARASVAHFSERTRQVGRDYPDGSEDTVSNVVQGAIGIFGSLVKAGVEKMGEEARKGRAERSTKDDHLP